jgi:hypothetical protein
MYDNSPAHGEYLKSFIYLIQQNLFEAEDTICASTFWRTEPTGLACPEPKIISAIMSLQVGGVTPTENFISERTQPIEVLSNF